MSTKGHGYWDEGGVERHFKTGIDPQLVSGVGIEQNSRGFIACTLHVLCMDCREHRVMGSVVSTSLPELCSVLNHRLCTKLVNVFPGRCTHCLLYRAQDPKQIDMRNTFIKWTSQELRDWVKWKCLVNINSLRWWAVTCHISPSRGPLSILLTQ